jgi:hypothetical protein
VGDISFPSPAKYDLSVTKGDYKSSFLVDSSVTKSFTKAVGGTGSYSITAKSQDSTISGNLETFEGEQTFSVTGDGVTFVYGVRLPRKAAVRQVIRNLDH